jgi:hypothetical protein
LERGPLSLVTTTEELLESKSSGYGLENREYGVRDPYADQMAPSNPQMLALTSPTIGGRWIGMVRSRTQLTEFKIFYALHILHIIFCRNAE